MSIADFKAKKGVERIEVKQNPQAGNVSSSLVSRQER